MYLAESTSWNFDKIHNDPTTHMMIHIHLGLLPESDAGLLLSIDMGIMVCAIPWVIVIRNIKVNDKPQVKGMVFSFVGKSTCWKFPTCIIEKDPCTSLSISCYVIICAGFCAAPSCLYPRAVLTDQGLC